MYEEIAVDGCASFHLSPSLTSYQHTYNPPEGSISTIIRLYILPASRALRTPIRRQYYSLAVLKERIADQFMAGPKVVDGLREGEVVVNGGSARKGGIQCWGHRGASGMSFPDEDVVRFSSVA